MQIMKGGGTYFYYLKAITHEVLYLYPIIIHWAMKWHKEHKELLNGDL